MQIQIVSRHITLSEDQAEHVRIEAGKLGKFFDGINGITVALQHVHDEFSAEIVCTVSGHGTLVAIETGRTVQEATDTASDNMIRQVKRYKEKLHGRRPHGAEPQMPPEHIGPETKQDQTGFAEEK